MTQLLPNEDGKYKVSTGGKIAVLASALYDEYGTIGYSVTIEDISIAIQNDFRFYAGWQQTHSQYLGEESLIDENTELSIDEWAVLEPVVRAHCDWMQANRVEGTQSLGGDHFGLSVSEASSNYALAKKDMQKEAFCEPPFTM